MSSPAPSNDGEAPKSNQEQITFRFCSECSNMLYPKEDEDAHKLQFTCRTCQYTEEATSSCVFRNVMNNAAGETAGVTQDVGSDPTVRNDVSSSYQTPPPASASTSTPASADNNVAICLRCGVTLLHCQSCEDPASVEEYNHFVAHHPEFAVKRSLNFLQSANCWNFLDDQGKAMWTDKFASCESPDTSDPSIENSLPYLSLDHLLGASDADPPEALEDPPDDDDVSMFY